MSLDSIPRAGDKCAFEAGWRSQRDINELLSESSDMSLYTLFIATALNVNKELSVQSGLTLDECKAAATQALIKDGSNYARCRPTQPEQPIVLVKLPSGVILELQRQHGGYRLPEGYTPQDEAFVAVLLGAPSSGVQSRAHGAKRSNAHDTPKIVVELQQPTENEASRP